MRYAHSIAILALMLLAPSASAAIELAFAEPSRIEGSMSVPSAQWSAFHVAEGTELAIDLAGDGRVVFTNLTFQGLETPVSSMALPPTGEQGSMAVPAMGLRLIAGPGGAGIAFQGDLGVTSTGSASLRRLSGTGVADTLGEGPGHRLWSTWASFSDNGVVLVSDAPHGGLALQSEALEAVEWFNMQPTCTASPCPFGGGMTQDPVGAESVFLARSHYRYERLEGDITARLVASGVSFAVAARTLDVIADGSAHLPVADAHGCDSCPPVHDQTLTLGGLVSLEGIESRPSGFTARLSGDFESARIDETWVSPESFGAIGGVTAAAVGLAIVVKLLLVPLFTRLSKQEALEHPKRQRIFAYIQEHPGANFREVARNTSIAAGTVRHHLTVLERAGHVVEHQHQGTVRLFENHGKFDHNWADLVLLREPPLAKLHAWLKEHPGSAQKAALEAMEAEGWSRSTTQHRLSRLVDGGLATIRLQGRLKIYTAKERTERKPTFIGLMPQTAMA